MDPQALRDNAELSEYLAQLTATLERCGHSKLVETVTNARRFASGSASEFLHEAQLSLNRVRNERPFELSSCDLQEVDAVLAQIEAAFQKIGGA